MFLVNEPELRRAAEKIVEKAWGAEFWLANTPKYCLKVLKVNPGFTSSVHFHKKKDETFIGMTGTVELRIHGAKPGTGQERHGWQKFPDEYDPNVFQSIAIVSGKKYRIEAQQAHSFRATTPSFIMEVSTHHDDNDVVRVNPSGAL